MNHKIKAPRGTQDIYPEDSEYWMELEKIALEVFSKAGFKEIRTPIFEASELFNRAVGEDSDIVNKEMYSFLDRSERSLTLRPEGTAGIVRAYIENSLDRELPKPQKFWYRGPMFRYERPQTGRYRQFHQIGIEIFGAKAPFIDIEAIKIGIDLLGKLGLENLSVCINSIGSSNSREKYKNALKNFLENHLDEICDDCKRRYLQNPLRVLDCKVPEDQNLYKEAPCIYDSFDDESHEIWELAKKQLKNLGVNFIEDPKLVRGLDYYSHLVFEIKTKSPSLGQQSTVLGGGRYDSLVLQLGGHEVPAVGWALGEERLVHLLKEEKIFKPKISKKIFIVSDEIAEAQKLCFTLRNELNLIIDYDSESTKFKKLLDKAIKQNFNFIIFYLEEERKSGNFKIKNLINKEEKNFDYEGMINFLKAID